MRSRMMVTHGEQVHAPALETMLAEREGAGAGCLVQRLWRDLRGMTPPRFARYGVS